MYNEIVSGLSSVYRRISWNNPNHEKVKEWEERGRFWNLYDKQLCNLFIGDKDEMEKEYQKAKSELNAMEELEQDLFEMNC